MDLGCYWLILFFSRRSLELDFAIRIDKMFSRMFGKPKQETNALTTLDKLNEVWFT